MIDYGWIYHGRNARARKKLNYIMVGYIVPDMASKKKNPNSRHGKLADGTSQTSITMKKELLQKAKAAAQKDGRSLSNWLEQLVKNSLILTIAGLLVFHLARSPRVWNAAALTATAKAAWSHVVKLAR